MEEQKQIQIDLEPNIVYLNAVQMGFDEEQFLFLMVSGNAARQYSVSPKHAKRILLLLQQKIKEYEGQYGELKTSLFGTKGETTRDKSFGFGKK